MLAMNLQYLIFDTSYDASGATSFDAMAAVRPDRQPALLAEVGSVLRWAQRTFGPPGVPGEEGEWDYDLQALAEPGGRLAIAHDASGQLTLAPAPPGALVTLTVTLSGSPGFRDAFVEAFPAGD